MRATRHLDRILMQALQLTFLPGTLGNSRSKTFDTFVAGAFITSAATCVDSSEAPTSSSKAIFFTVTFLLMRGFSIGSVPNRQSVSVLQ